MDHPIFVLVLSTLTLRKPSEAPEVARMILHGYPQHRVFALHGDLGAGKTTLIKALCQELGVTGGTSSPSFAIVNEYRAGNGDPVYHLDLYRLKDAGELEAIGFTDHVDSGHYCFLEWPELAQDLLPADALHLRLLPMADGQRMVRIGW
jgi:tRNA threonylcarbamoyladenosine biosynthesis protein TsaE